VPPPEGGVVVEPCENGWLVMVFEEDEEADELTGESSDELPTYDPSAEFARQRCERQGTPNVIAHMHMQSCGPEPKKFVFIDHAKLIEFLATRLRPKT
jgi:hypothetical protein